MSKAPRTLTAWAFLQIWRPDGSRSPQAPILAGIDDLGLNRTSTPLVKFDPASGVGITGSGREYRLVGHEDPVTALRAFSSLWMLQDGQEIRRVAPEAVPAVIATSASPTPKSAEETAEDEFFRIRACVAQIERLARLRGIGDAKVAPMLGVSRVEYVDMKAGGAMPSGISVDGAERVLAHVNARVQDNGFDLEIPDSDERAFRVHRMRNAARSMEVRMAETRRHRLERAAFALPFVQMTDPDLTDEQYAESLGVTPEELREILAEIPDDDDNYTVPPPGMRH
ncbi:MAG: hypothetical protein ACT6QU_14720 [Aliihoeflea sp.]|uniref:hypothetical protein n=1 Tax=Aliihoeflea sp. TaxID=2608088 RepID=UPI004033ACBB